MTSIYVIKESGLLALSVTDGESDDKHNDLMSGFLTAVHSGAFNYLLGGNIDYVVSDNGMVLTYGDFKVHDIPFTMVVVTKMVNGKVGLKCRSKMHQFKMFIQEQNRWQILTNNELANSHTEMVAKLRELFL